jgi:Tfp pilus assembly protein PilV
MLELHAGSVVCGGSENRQSHGRWESRELAPRPDAADAEPVFPPSGLKQQHASAETHTEDKHSALVMIRTIFPRLKHSTRRSVPAPFRRPGTLLPALVARGTPSLASETGDTLIEVIISAVLIALVVVASLTGLDSANRSVALQRARSQADALAQQDEDQLRGEPVAKLSELSRERCVNERGATVLCSSTGTGGTVYKITSTSQYVSDATATASCSSSSPSADYLQTTSKVTWPSLGVGKPVVETSVISPPPGAALIVQVTESGTAIQGAQVVATGPSPETTERQLETSSDGCAILAVLPGEYQINVSKSGYVDPNGYANTHEDVSVTRSVYLPAETTAKEGYYLAPAGKLAVGFTGSSYVEGDTFVAHNSGMTTFRPFGSAGTYKPTVESPATVYPFLATSPYTVYAGSCESDRPKALSAGNPEVEVVVPAGGTAPVAVTQPPVKIKLMSGTGPGASTEGSLVTTGSGYTTDTGCGTKRVFASTPGGALPRPGLPYGNYTMCVSNGARRWEGSFSNNVPAGPSTAWTNGGTSSGTATVYLGTSPSGSPSGTNSGSCP